MEHAHILSRTDEILPSELPDDVMTGDIEQAMQQDGFLTFKQLQKQLVVRALQKANGRKMAAAKLLDIDHRKLGRLVEQFELDAAWK
jgi:transcriptional regulator with GAF, ATPase, and Fis domain